MSNNPIILITLCAGFLLLGAGSCTVREDRDLCPSYLSIDYSSLQSSGLADNPSAKVEAALFDDDGLCWSSRYALSECPSSEEVQVTRSHPRLVVLVHDDPDRNYLSGGTQVRCEPGQPVDALYLHSETVDCSGEGTRSVVQQRKQFSTLVFSDSADGALLRMYDLVLRGTTCGFDAEDGTALDGVYECMPEDEDGNGRISARIPRQKRDDLLLEFRDKEGGQKWFTSPVGQYLFSAGYDPDAPDLPDYEIRIDFSRALLYLRVSGWTDEYLYSLYE